jgi:hypothetical protein
MSCCDLVQVDVDVEVYNEMIPEAKRIQLVLDFKDDVAERRTG